MVLLQGRGNRCHGPDRPCIRRGETSGVQEDRGADHADRADHCTYLSGGAVFSGTAFSGIFLKRCPDSVPGSGIYEDHCVWISLCGDHDRGNGIFPGVRQYQGAHVYCGAHECGQHCVRILLYLRRFRRSRHGNQGGCGCPCDCSGGGGVHRALSAV